MQFQEMGLSPSIIKELQAIEIHNPSEIQEKAISSIFSTPRSHIIGQAKTGSGKTLAYAIPIVEFTNPLNKNVQAVVLVPTRELCKQVATVIRSLSHDKKINVVEVYGGVSITRQIDEIRKSGQIVVATTGRLIDIYKRRQIGFKNLKFLALDEADRMLDMGFLPDVEFLLLDAMRNATPRLMLFSATLLPDIRRIAKKFVRDEPLIEVDVSKDTLTVSECEQFHVIIKNNKFWNFVRVLKAENPEYSIIFTRTKRGAKDLCKKLKMEHKLGLRVEFLHGDVSQAQRESIVKQFREKQINCLIGTDVLARGLDFPRVSHVFNYDLPMDEEDYVHRIGRTARMGCNDQEVSSGRAISMVASSQLRDLQDIEKFIGKKIARLQVANVEGEIPPMVQEIPERSRPRKARSTSHQDYQSAPRKRSSQGQGRQNHRPYAHKGRSTSESKKRAVPRQNTSV